MTKKIFRSFMLSAVAVLLAGVVIVMTCLYSYFASVQESQLQDQLQLAAAAVETEGTDYLNKLNKLKADRYRLTWIAADGSVLCDTKRDAESLENHGDRLEVREAREGREDLEVPLALRVRCSGAWPRWPGLRRAAFRPSL